MTRDDETCLRIGREIVRMIHELRDAAAGDTGYTRRRFTFGANGEVYVFIATLRT